MIEKLKFLIDECENNPKLKELMLKVAGLPEDKQDDMLKVIELIVKNR